MKFSISGVLRCAGMSLVAVALSAPVQAQPVILWGSASGASRSTPGVWGNGAAARTREQSYEGAAVLKVTARNPQEGARFDVEPPVDLKPFLGENGLLRLRVRFRDAPIPVVQPPAVGEVPGFPGGLPGFGTPGFGTPGVGVPAAPAAPLNFPGGFGAAPARPQSWTNAQLQPRLAQLQPRLAQLQPRLAQFSPLPPLGNQGFPTVPPAAGIGAAIPGEEAAQPVWTGPPPQETALKRLLVTLLLDKGALVGYVDLDLEQEPPDDNGWRLFALPISEMRTTPGANGMLRRVLITSDDEDSFYLEQMALMVETDALSVSIRRPEDPPGARIAEITVRPGPLTLVADVESGASDVIIEWNFDADNLGTLPPPALGPPPVVLQEGAAPVAGGPRIDVRGPVARFEYPNEEQNYRVQVTVRDRVGKKAPVTASILVRTRG